MRGTLVIFEHSLILEICREYERYNKFDRAISIFFDALLAALTGGAVDASAITRFKDFIILLDLLKVLVIASVKDVTFLRHK